MPQIHFEGATVPNMIFTDIGIPIPLKPASASVLFSAMLPPPALCGVGDSDAAKFLAPHWSDQVLADSTAQFFECSYADDITSQDEWYTQAAINIQTHLVEQSAGEQRYDSPIVYAQSLSPTNEFGNAATPLKTLFPISNESSFQTTPFMRDDGACLSPLSPSQGTEYEMLSSSQRPQSQMLHLEQGCETVRCLFASYSDLTLGDYTQSHEMRTPQVEMALRPDWGVPVGGALRL